MAEAFLDTGSWKISRPENRNTPYTLLQIPKPLRGRILEQMQGRGIYDNGDQGAGGISEP